MDRKIKKNWNVCHQIIEYDMRIAGHIQVTLLDQFFQWTKNKCRIDYKNLTHVYPILSTFSNETGNDYSDFFTLGKNPVESAKYSWHTISFTLSRESAIDNASFTPFFFFYHTFSASIRHILLACVNAPHIFCDPFSENLACHVSAHTEGGCGIL